MCSVILLRRPDHAWPLLVAANRDEMINRPWLPPARHWPDRAEVIAGLDEQGGGTWFGVNDFGVMATVLNRTGTLGSEADKRSRGELVLDALDHADAIVAADALCALDPAAYRPFNLMIADNRDAFWLAHRGDGRITVTPIPEGISMIGAEDLNDPTSPRVRRHSPNFAAAPTPDPERGDWRGWQALLTDRSDDAHFGPHNALCFQYESGFATVCHQLLALPRIGSGRKPRWLFAQAVHRAHGAKPGDCAWNAVLPD